MKQPYTYIIILVLEQYWIKKKDMPERHIFGLRGDEEDVS
jgi:hypothetical protein